MTITVLGAFGSTDQAAQAVEQLTEAGFERQQISIAVSDRAHALHFSAKRDKTVEGIGVGSVAGGVLGGIIAGLTTAATIVVPGVGLLVAGPLVGTFVGMDAGAVVGTLVGGLIGHGIPEHEAKMYEQAVKEGSLLVAVQATDADNAGTARRILDRAGAAKFVPS